MLLNLWCRINFYLPQKILFQILYHLKLRILNQTVNFKFPMKMTEPFPLKINFTLYYVYNCNHITETSKRNPKGFRQTHSSTYWMSGTNGVLHGLSSSFVDQCKTWQSLFILHSCAILLIFDPVLQSPSQSEVTRKLCVCVNRESLLLIRIKYKS